MKRPHRDISEWDPTSGLYSLHLHVRHHGKSAPTIITRLIASVLYIFLFFFNAVIKRRDIIRLHIVMQVLIVLQVLFTLVFYFRQCLLSGLSFKLQQNRFIPGTHTVDSSFESI